MSDMNALLMTIYTMVMIFFMFHTAMFLVMLPIIQVVISYLDEELELDFLETISLCWFFFRTPEALSNAMEAINNKESVAEQVYDLTDDDDDDDDDDDGGTPIDERYLAKQ